VFVVPVLVFLFTRRLLRALARSGAPRFSEMPAAALRRRFRQGPSSHSNR
jgi:hypothetical protein